MSMIQCPKCGKDVSNKEMTCPHCGYELQKSVQVGNVIPMQSDIANPEEEWKVKCPQKAVIKKFLWILQSFFGFIAVIPCVVVLLALFDIIYPLKGSEIENYGQIIQNVFIMAIILGCCYAFARSVAVYFRATLITKWITQTNYNVLPFLKKEDIMITGTKADAYWAAYCKLSPNGKTVYGLYSIITGASFGTIAILFFVILRNVYLSRLEQFLAGTKWIPEVSWIYFIIILGVLLITLTVTAICSKACKNYLTAYVTKNKIQ